MTLTHTATLVARLPLSKGLCRSLRPWALVFMTSLTATLAPSAQAVTVFDPSNFSQNLLIAIRTLEQINNQVEQLQNEARMLTNDARNLAGLDFDASERLRRTLATTTRLIQQAKGLAYEVSQADANFARLYPEAYAQSISGNQMAADARERWRTSLEALRTTLIMQAQSAQNLAVDEQTLTDLVAQSQGAQGNLQAAQATNQLLALQARQSIQAQQLQITQGRAQALEQARQVAAEERSREVRRRFDSGTTRYNPHTVRFYGP